MTTLKTASFWNLGSCTHESKKDRHMWTVGAHATACNSPVLSDAYSSSRVPTTSTDRSLCNKANCFGESCNCTRSTIIPPVCAREKACSWCWLMHFNTLVCTFHLGECQYQSLTKSLPELQQVPRRFGTDPCCKVRASWPVHTCGFMMEVVFAPGALISRSQSLCWSSQYKRVIYTNTRHCCFQMFPTEAMFTFPVVCWDQCVHSTLRVT